LLLAVKNLSLPVELKEEVAQDAVLSSSKDNILRNNPVCFEVPSMYEITVNGKKLIGSAQARKREGVLQHGSLPLTGDLSRICQALVFENESDRKDASQRLLVRATTVESALGRVVDWDTAAQAFVSAFEAQLEITFEHGELSESESKTADRLVSEKYDHPSWTERT
jgi:lipoate-protein ligase A